MLKGEGSGLGLFIPADYLNRVAGIARVLSDFFTCCNFTSNLHLQCVHVNLHLKCEAQSRLQVFVCLVQLIAWRFHLTKYMYTYQVASQKKLGSNKVAVEVHTAVLIHFIEHLTFH